MPQQPTSNTLSAAQPRAPRVHPHPISVMRRIRSANAAPAISVRTSAGIPIFGEESLRLGRQSTKSDDPSAPVARPLWLGLRLVQRGV
jgi:hypothetical protein